jgi:hypothetical protein
MLPDGMRLRGLSTALTIKHTQNDVVVVDSLDTLDVLGDEMVAVCTDNGARAHTHMRSLQYLHALADRRNWGYSVLFVDA